MLWDILAFPAANECLALCIGRSGLASFEIPGSLPLTQGVLGIFPANALPFELTEEVMPEAAIYLSS